VAGMLACVASADAATDPVADPAVPLDLAIAAAENSLREGEPQLAESHYRMALSLGWQLRGALEMAEGRLREARDAFARAASAVADNRAALHSLALAHLQMGEAAKAVDILTRLADRDPKDVITRRLLARALVDVGQRELAVQRLEEAAAVAPDDLELGYALATGWLRLKKTEPAERQFAKILRSRPIPQAHLLIGRAYREASEFARARSELRAALQQDPRTRGAHYYLGLVDIDEQGTGPDKRDSAIAEFQEELKLTPGDPVTSMQLGMALVEARRLDEALPALERAAAAQPPQARTFYYLGRALHGLDRPAEAVDALRRALVLAPQQGATEAQLISLHNQLGQALRKAGAREEAEAEFAEAKRVADRRIDTSREQLSRYMSDAGEPGQAAPATVSQAEPHPLAELPPARRLELRGRATAGLARAYFNLAVLQAQGERFARAAELFENAAEVDPEFPQVQSSLGVAYFNARQFEKAAAPLARALEANPSDVGVKRMLAMARLNAQAYDKAAALLEDEPARRTDPSLQFAYGLALVRSGRASEAEAVFTRLLREHGDWAEMSVLLGQAHAAQGKYDLAIAALKRALELKPDVAEAQATLGRIYLRQGRLAEAEQELRAELTVNPQDGKAQHDLALVLETAQRSDEAIALLRGVLVSQPDFADARYLLGKLLVARGAAAEALEHLEAAARLSPGDENVHFQLANAYRKLGNTERVKQELDIFRELKAKRAEPAATP
jgi:tetratricopeptide (TPR) repeat protein